MLDLFKFSSIRISAFLSSYSSISNASTELNWPFEFAF